MIQTHWCCRRERKRWWPSRRSSVFSRRIWNATVFSASIQAEVTATLNSVISQAVDGIRMLDAAEAQGKEPTADEISATFKAIGEQGRAALKRMRELLGVLRETGFSDDAHAGSASELQLRPAAPLEEQLQRASR